jgi:hypothetical protein
MKKIIKIILIVAVAALVIIQVFRPDKTSSSDVTADDITKKMQVPENVQQILKRSCYDCHSNQTTWPWYSNVAPMSWLVAKDVRNGRGKMNFSEWGKIPSAKQEARLEAICEEIKEDEMPLKNYLLLHGDAKLSQLDKDILCKWVESELKKMEEEGEK